MQTIKGTQEQQQKPFILSIWVKLHEPKKNYVISDTCRIQTHG